MPYITVEDYKRVQHIINPIAPSNGVELNEMEQDIYALNRQIRDLPGAAPTLDWLSLMQRHERLLFTYRKAGGTRL